MGLIKAALGAIGGNLGDQWKEYFYCDSMSSDVLAVKGKKRVGDRSSNKHGEDNIISDKSVIAVNEGQCMMIVENGKIAELCAEPGEFIYDSNMSPSIFAGNLKDGLKGTLRDIWDRFTFGGTPGRDQRVYYFNIKEIAGNKYGTPAPVPFRVVDKNIGLDVDISVRCNGEYSYKIVNPMVFYTNVCANVTNEFRREEIDSMLKTEILTALQPAFARISEMGIRYSALPGHTVELTEIMNDVLSKKWGELRGLTIYSIGINSITAPKEDEDMIKELQKSAVLKDPTMGAATLTAAQAQAMKDAAKNDAGAMTGFMGFGMAANAGNGMNTANLYEMGRKAEEEKAEKAAAAAAAGAWTCECGKENTGKFCSECGKPKPEADKWICSCGAENSGKFCSECGKPKPESDKWTCSCGTENTGKFCSECGKARE
ncbi:MAG: SPFH domain-containing protein [Clostridia bacterium]|nr:SPFH domain-containing protein [Clostridia bacterium]